MEPARPFNAPVQAGSPVGARAHRPSESLASFLASGGGLRYPKPRTTTNHSSSFTNHAPRALRSARSRVSSAARALGTDRGQPNGVHVPSQITAPRRSHRPITTSPQSLRCCTLASQPRPPPPAPGIHEPVFALAAGAAYVREQLFKTIAARPRLLGETDDAATWPTRLPWLVAGTNAVHHSCVSGRRVAQCFILPSSHPSASSVYGGLTALYSTAESTASCIYVTRCRYSLIQAGTAFFQVHISILTEMTSCATSHKKKKHITSV